MSASTPEKQGRALLSNEQPSTSSSAQSNPQLQTQQPDWRSPTGNVSDNPNAIPNWPAKYQVGDAVWVYREGDGWVQAKISSVQSSGASWGYHLKDKNGRAVWLDRPTLFRENELSVDEGDD
ncbi:uncharacterized protein BDR25DRAFT_303769 [Lindgomyces ingoldianus]|uniref:Uncharacterized protein n=1 Tax=Lindgomyces ingoldianus TaxID=673940 RepID=A0ACB6QW97_9PLEO|nr:uncharacterized protein BDR25DRAFT_303769 [Lindgomyces ingoldianus]KAF2470785.1 hypothetical protein BDR25DRAFT_303769 [Lindgomyces ingoldianus]